MAVSTEWSSDGATLRVAISGRFDFHSHREFSDAYKEADPGRTHVVIDMAQVEYMDSAALGMLLLLRERHGGDQARVRITNCNEATRKILTISNFHRLFEID